jgi:hypothetical protein
MSFVLDIEWDEHIDIFTHSELPILQMTGFMDYPFVFHALIEAY